MEMETSDVHQCSDSRVATHGNLTDTSREEEEEGRAEPRCVERGFETKPKGRSKASPNQAELYSIARDDYGTVVTGGGEYLTNVENNLRPGI